MDSQKGPRLIQFKVPTYLEQAILSQGKEELVGKLTVREVDGVPQDAVFEIEEEMAKTFDPEMPRKYDVAIGQPPTHHENFFTEKKTGVAPKPGQLTRVRYEGEIKGQMFASSPDGMAYRMKLWDRARKAEPKTILIEGPVEEGMPEISDEEGMAEDGKRRRLDHESLVKLLTKMFTEKTELSFKEIRSYTEQPYEYLYKVLRTVAEYNNVTHLWQLKPSETEVAM